MALEPINTRARSKSKGNRYGLEGNLYLWLVGAAFLSVGVVAFAPNAWSLYVRFGLGLFPITLAGLYVLLLKHGRPPNYDRDTLGAMVNGRSFDQSQQQPVHPMIGAQRRAAVAQARSRNF